MWGDFFYLEYRRQETGDRRQETGDRRVMGDECHPEPVEGEPVEG